jgi:hypothetical protein
VEIRGSQFKASLGKKFMRPHLEEWLSVMVHTFHPTFVGDTNRTVVQPGTGMKQDATSKIISAKALAEWLTW